KLSNLQSLDLSDNNISDISFLEKLSNLQSLYLNDNNISDISFLEKLPSLQTLWLYENVISDISSIKYLKNLNALQLGKNQISDISPLAKLENLKKIGLNNNRIKKLPQWVLDFNLDIEYSDSMRNSKLVIGENPIESPPIEIVKKGRNEIKKYFDDLEKQGKDYLYEAKLLIVGDGGAGKTSLAWKMKRLDSEMPKEGDDRTKGIDIQAMPIHNIQKPEIPFLMNVWDFGGQGYYHSTHQFFLTKRSLYVLLNSTRINKTDFNDWLQTIALFSDNSPVILVENEVGGSKSELDLRGLRRFFENILYVRNADIADITDGRLEKLINDIQIEIQRLPHIGSELPKQWVEIRESLRDVANTEAYISDKDFYEICRHHSISEKDDIQRLGGLFHDLGVFLHFRDDKVLKKIVILQNAWATKGVYTILDDSTVRSQNGYFTIEQAEDIWNKTPYEDMHDELVSLMEKFKLCYRIPYSSPTAYISPNLLPVEQPDYDWDSYQNLIINYDYEFMPKGLLGMLIVELHRYVKDIKNRAWKNGCVFHYQNTDAQVIETYGKKTLEIRVKGAHCVHLSSIIISEIDKLNDTFNRIKVKKLIPCHCSDCQHSDDPQFYDYKYLLRRKEKNKLTVECSYSFEEIQVLEILEASYNEHYIEEPTLKKLISQGKIKEAIDVFEQDFPMEGTLLLSKLNQLERYYYLGMISLEELSVNKQQIANSLLGLSENQAQEPRTNVEEEIVELNQLDEKLRDIQTKLEGQNVLLNSIINRGDIYQHELIELLLNIENKEESISEDFAQDIITIIEKGMADFSQKVPDATSIIEDWEKASKQLKLATDYKVKLKWTIPFLFLKLEKEINWDGKDWFRAIRDDVKRGVKGNWSEMFISG
ncbi:MAG: leucine-rich repeat domain-containing protein, partial [Chitinophagales bacterium]|nr:leucine-rich repeat domain-containing protein [Chitinophagales bacterium]